METNVINKKYSRYTQGGLSTLSADNKVKWWERRILEKSDDDLIVEILPRFNKRPDRLAFELYGKAELGWLILQYNVILDINDEFITNRIIKAPHPNRVIFDILNQSTGGVDE
jgi:hypothetical protein